MKKLLTLFLSILLLLSFCACGAQEATPGATTAAAGGASTLMVGYARVDITPEENVAMAIYGSETERISTGYMDPLYGYALAVTGSNDETLLILTCDHSWYNTVAAKQARQQLGKEFGLEEENIIVTGTHNHSAPDLSADHIATARYADLFTKTMIKAGQAAMNDRKPATMYAGSAQAEGLTFVRRYVLKDGTYPNFQTVSSDRIADHESEADTQLQVMRFVREGERDIALYNWQAHVNMNMQIAANYNLLTSDIFGAFRDEVEKALDADVFIWNGAAGNLNPTSQITEENPTWDHRQYGKLLGAYGVEAFQNATQLSGTTVGVITTTYTGTVNHTYDNVVMYARDVLAYYQATGDDAGTRAMGAQYGINTQKHAARIIGNASLGKTRDILLRAFSIGDVGVICLRYEMFDTNGMYIKENSPFKQTFIMGYTESGQGYIPSGLVEDHGGYEVDNNVYVMGTGEILANEYLALLNALAQ